MILYIYKIINIINNKIYIGKHLDKSKSGMDGYLGSGVLIKKARLKYGDQYFKKEILEYCTLENVSEKEQYYINKFKSLVPNGYNISKGGVGGNSTKGTVLYHNSKTHTVKYIKPGDDIPEGYEIGNLKHTIKTKQILSSKLKNRKLTEEWKKKISNTLKGKSLTTETKIKISNAEKGEKNHMAKTYLIIDPKGNEYLVKGRIKAFCVEYNLSYTLVKQYKNKGKIPERPAACTSIMSKNTVGWSFKII